MIAVTNHYSVLFMGHHLYLIPVIFMASTAILSIFLSLLDEGYMVRVLLFLPSAPCSLLSSKSWSDLHKCQITSCYASTPNSPMASQPNQIKAHAFERAHVAFCYKHQLMIPWRQCLSFFLSFSYYSS